jgi:hypothetical protein
MKEILRFWRDKSREEKQEIKSSHNVKVVTYSFIEKHYLESIKTTDNFELD